MNMKRGIGIAILIMSAVVVAGCPAPKSKAVKCMYCNMMVDLPKDKQGAKIVFGDGSEEYYCTMAHALKTWEMVVSPEWDPDDPMEDFLVVDYDDSKLIEAKAAFYIYGSDEPPAMFDISLVAFEKLADAEKFMHRHGGKMMYFDEVVLQTFTNEE